MAQLADIQTERDVRRLNRPYFDIRRNAKQADGLAMLQDASKTRVLFDGGGRSGKTDLVCAWLLARALWFPGSRQIILRKQINQTRNTIWQDTLERLREKFLPARYYKAQQEDMTLRFFNGSRIECDGCDDEARVRKIFGREFLTMFWNEASELRGGVVLNGFSRAVQRCEGLDGRLGVCKTVFDTNPRGPKHWLHRMGVEGIHPETDEPLTDRRRWARLGGWTPYDNAKNLAPGAIAEYEAMQGVQRRQLLDGEWCSEHGLVYQEFDYDRHVLPKGAAHKGKRVLGSYQCRAIDFGYRDPFVCLWGTVDNDGALTIFDSIYRKNTIVSEHAARIKDKSNGMAIAWTVADHDAEDAATLKAEGVRTRRAKKDRPISAGIERVKRRFSEGRLKITANCKQLISEIQSYSWDEDAPEDENNHALDALRYMVAQLDGKKRKAVEAI